MTASRPAARLCLVTGGGGFLGRAVVEQFRARGDRVRSFSRQDYPELRASGVEVTRGDLRDPAAVAAAAAGCDVVFHVAAKAGFWGRYRDYYEPNVRGTENVIAACRATGVPNLVYTSSPSVVFDGDDMEGVDESVPYARRPRSHYSATKAIAERLVLEASGDAVRTIALRPHLIWGPRDPHLVPRLVARARTRRLARIGDGTNRVDTTYIENAARAHVLAADALEQNPRAAGRAFFITNGEPALLWELIDRMLAAAGLPPLRRSISRGLAWTLGAACEAAYGLARLDREPPMTRFVADELSKSHWFDISAARRELGYTPTVTLEEGLRRLAGWLAGQATSQPGGST